MKELIVIATPHARFDPVEAVLRGVGNLDIVRIRDPRELTHEALAELTPRWIFFPHWSWKIPSEIYQDFDCVVFHMTDVPFGRGGSPLQNLIARGFESTKLTALRCVEEMDAGPVYMKRDLSLLGTAEEILIRASTMIGDMIHEIALKSPAPVPQSGEATTFKRRTPAQSDLRNATTLKEAHDLIRMLDADGYPRAFADIGPFRIEFSRSSLRQDEILADARISIRSTDP
jgi:methionyl-tRNA formyltransferase